MASALAASALLAYFWGVLLCPRQWRLLYELFMVKFRYFCILKMTGKKDGFCLFNVQLRVCTIPEISALRASLWTFCVSLISSIAMILLNVTEIKNTACNLWAQSLWKWGESAPPIYYQLCLISFHFNESTFSFIRLMHMICNKMEEMEETKWYL